MNIKIYLLLIAAFTTLTLQALTVNNVAGNLSHSVSDKQITQLTVTGTMDARDFLFITRELTELTTVDLSQATIVPFDRGQALYGMVTKYNANEIPRTAFFGKKLTSVTLPATIESVGFGAFAGCDRLTSVTLPAAVTRLDDYAFAGSGLTAIELPSTILSMGKGVFARCESLATAVVNTRMVGDFAFLGDTNLSNVTLGAGVEYIFKGAFNGCASLKRVTLTPGIRLARIDDEAFINSGLESIDIKSVGLGTVGEWAFAQTSLSSLTLSDGMTSLGEGALAHNPLLSSVTLPGIANTGSTDNGRAGDGDTGGRRRAAATPARTLTEIADYAFAGDELLQAGALLRDDVSRIGAYAFYNVSADIDTMRLPQTVTSLGDMAMAGMTGMKTLKVAAEQVPELGSDVWAGVDQPSVPLITPNDESNLLYKEAEQWMNFFFEADFLLGDVNGDGFVNIADVTTLIDYLLGSGMDIDARAADMSGDGSINIADVTALIDYLLTGSASKTLQRISAQEREMWTTTSDGLSMNSLSIRPDETRTIDIALTARENEYVALQCELVLPQGLTLEAVEGIDRGNDNSCFFIRHEVEPNVYTLMAVSMSMTSYGMGEGNVLRLTVKADEAFDAEDTHLELANVLTVTREHHILLAQGALAKVNDGSGVEQVNAGKEVAGVRYINVSGQESDTPFDGVNIVVTTYTDGSTTTIKVMR